MSLDLSRKICSLAQLTLLAQRYAHGGKVTVHCHGCFDIVHPGHLRYLQFARRQGDVLIVSLTGDDAIEKSDGTRPYIPQDLRAENLAALEFVDHVVIADGPTAEPVIKALRPEIYIKGKEYEHATDPGFLAEKKLVEDHGGRVIYSSGEVVFSSTDLLARLGQTLETGGFSSGYRLAAWCDRWGIQTATMRTLLRQGFAGKRIAVVGDALRDQYVFCDPVNIAGEAPILSVRPLEEACYLGGSAIIAAHLKALGAQPHLLTTIGWDDASADLVLQLQKLGIAHTTFSTRKQLPVKRRYLVEKQKLLKVDQATAQPLDSATERRLLETLCDLRTDLDAIIFADFGYGTLTCSLLEQAMPLLRQHVGTIVGDASGPQLTLLACHGADLLTPSERELRSIVGDFEQSLPTVAFSLMKKLRLANLAVTMGQHGCLLFRPREEDPDQWFNSRLRSQHLPSLATHAVDPLGAGDAFLATVTLALSAGATLAQAGFIASAAAALEVAKIGNIAISADELESWLLAEGGARLARPERVCQPTANSYPSPAIVPRHDGPRLRVTRP